MQLNLSPGLNILVGPNDAGKSAIIDAARYVLWTRDDYNLLCRQLQKAAVRYVTARPPTEVSEMLAVGISGLAWAHGWKAANDRPIFNQGLA